MSENVWNERYRQQERLWTMKTEPKIIKYLDLIKEGNILDLGIGEGRNSLPFTIDGFKIYGTDISEIALERCRENLGIKGSVLTNCDIRDYEIEQNKFTFIIASYILNFFKKSEINIIMDKIRKGVMKNGIVYVGALSLLEPNYEEIKKKCEEVEENTFYLENKKSHAHFFTQEELKEYFKDFEIICCMEGVEYDHGHGEPHYHGIIEFMARKK